MEFLKHKWPEILIITIMIPGFFGLGKLSWDLSDRMARAETRTDGIVAALPDLRTRVAFETVYGKFPQAVVLTKPKETVGGWTSNVAILSSNRDSVTFYRINLPTNDNSDLIRLITGAVYQADDTAISFERLKDMSADVKFVGVVPEYVDSKGSFVVFSSSESIDAAVEKLSGASQTEITTLESLDTWPALVDSLVGGELGQRTGG